MLRQGVMYHLSQNMIPCHVAHTQGIISSIECTPKAVVQQCKDIKSQLICMKNIQSKLANLLGGL